MQNQLDQLRSMTAVVADTSDFTQILQFAPIDATTNPSLILQSSKNPAFAFLIKLAQLHAQTLTTDPQERLNLAMEKVLVNFGSQILKIIPGRVSMEIDARASFDTKKSVEKARRIIGLFEEINIPKSRILVKLAATWQGIEAAKILEKENIHCNLTLIFSLIQAIAAAEAGATVISPFVGRVSDWYLQKYPNNRFAPHDDPGVILVTQIYNYLKKFNYSTQVMGASFRSPEQIICLAGCDLLTISPALLQKLKDGGPAIQRKLSAMHAKNLNIVDKIAFDEQIFQEKLNANPMAAEKLQEGIKRFVEDTEKLEGLLKAQL